MLELPEARVITDQLNATVRGKTIRNAVAAASPHGFAWYSCDPAGYQTLLSGRVIDRVDSYAGYVELSAGNVRLAFHDGVNIRFFAPGETLPKKHQLLIEFEDESAIACTVQMYGGLPVFLEGENDNPYYLAAREKPAPLSEAFVRAYFDSLLSGLKPTLSVKAFLATEQRIPGLGNGVLQDILFHARVHPKSKLSALTDGDFDRLYHSVRQTLFDMTSRGGRNTERDLFGCPGGYRTLLSKKTAREPCPVCGGELVREAYLGGNVYYCSACQPLKK